MRIWSGALLAPAAVAGAIGLVPVWSHVTLVGSGLKGIIAVFDEVAVYPSDICLGVLAVVAIIRPIRLNASTRWLTLAGTLLAIVATLSARSALNPSLAGGVAAQLAILMLAWLGLQSARLPRTLLVSALVAASIIESALAVGQFALQQPLIPSELPLPWLPSDAADAGAPVILSTSGERLLRGFGTFPHPNVLGGYLAIALVSLPLLQQRWPAKTLMWWAVGAAICVGLLASFSRAGWLAAGVGLGVSWCAAVRRRQRRWWFPPILGVAGLAALAFSPVGPTIGERFSVLGPDANPLERGSIENRLALDASAFAEIRDHLPEGVGAANYGPAALAGGYQEGWGEPAPNLVLLIAAELGAAGLVVLAAVGLGVVATIRARVPPPAVSAAFLALVVLGMFDHYTWTMPLGRVVAWIPFALLATSDAVGRDTLPAQTCKLYTSRAVSPRILRLACSLRKGRS